MSAPVIQVENLSKAYRIGLKEEITDTLVGAATSWMRAPLRNLNRLGRLNTHGSNGDSEDTLWALKDVSFDVQEGEVVGIIGRNGAGKSTLLKILSRITDPTSGRAIIRGRVSSLLEVGTGFHPELTGRENIYMNGTILGMRKREIDRKFDEIVDFSGVEKFLDTPVKRYSSGMTVRLAFAVAAHLEPEILVIDEVLAVGDAEFQKKCLGKMKDVATEGRTVLFVSHNMPAVRSLTTGGVYLRAGELRYHGATGDVIESYLQEGIAHATADDGHSLDYYRRNQISESPVHLRRIWLDTNHETIGKLPILSPSAQITIHIEIHSDVTLSDACVSLTLIRNHEQRVTTLFTKDAKFRLGLSPGSNSLRCSINDLPLTPGVYTLDCGVNKNANARAYDVVLDYPLFEVQLPEVSTGELDWANRPWGTIHWDKVTWQKA